MHAHVVVVGDFVPVEALRVGHVGARVGAPDLANGAHRARALPEERAVGFPVDLLVLEPDQRDGRVRVLLKGAALPAVDQVGAVVAGLRGVRDRHAADHPAAARMPGIRVARHADTVAREAIGRGAGGVVGDGRAASGVVRRAADVAGEVRPVPRVARAELLGIVVTETALVDPLGGVRIARVVDVAVGNVERRAPGLKEEIHEPPRRRVERIDDGERLAIGGARRHGGADWRLLARVARHEDDLVVVVERGDRVGGGPVPRQILRGAVAGDLLPGLDVPGVRELLVGAGVDAEVGMRVRETVEVHLVDLHRDLRPPGPVPAVGGDLVDIDTRAPVGRDGGDAVVGIAVADESTGGIGHAGDRRCEARPARELRPLDDDRLDAASGGGLCARGVRQGDDDRERESGNEAWPAVRHSHRATLARSGAPESMKQAPIPGFRVGFSRLSVRMHVSFRLRPSARRC